MSTLRSLFSVTTGALALGCAFIVSAGSVSALGLKDCSDKFSAAKAAGKTGTKTFADFMKSDCGDDAKPATPASAATPAKPVAPAATVAPVKPASPAAATATPVAPTTPTMTRAEKRKAAKDARAAAAPAATTAAPAVAGAAVFPAKVADAYSAKKPSKARMATCLDQYRLNKATKSNGGLKWIQKGGGYYSQCNKKLKG